MAPHLTNAELDWMQTQSANGTHGANRVDVKRECDVGRIRVRPGPGRSLDWGPGGPGEAPFRFPGGKTPIEIHQMLVKKREKGGVQAPHLTKVRGMSNSYRPAP